LSPSFIFALRFLKWEEFPTRTAEGLKLSGAHNPLKKERWVRGLNQQFAKLSYALKRTGGSNPPLSANELLNFLTGIDVLRIFKPDGMFDFEKLEVYQIAKTVVHKSLREIYANQRIDPYLKDQWKQASLCILLDLAEATGRLLTDEKRQLINKSRSSVFECASMLEILKELELIDKSDCDWYYEQYERLSKMLLAMYRSHEHK
jgi:four helix bundle protein